MFRMPLVTKNLLIINVLAFLAMVLTGGVFKSVDLNDLLGLHFFLASDFQIYQLFTYMFMHGSLPHLFFNMFALWMFGCVVENVWGTRKFLFYYIACGVGAGLFQEATQYFHYAMLEHVSQAMGPSGLVTGKFVIEEGMAVDINLWTTVGASGSIYGILLAFGMLFPENRVFIFPLPVPIKAKWFVMIYAAIELFSAIGSSGDGVAHIAHLGGMVFGFFLIRYWRRHPYRSSFDGNNIFGNMRDKWERNMHNTSSTQYNTYEKSNADWTYNQQKKTRQEDIDAILDKIRKSGYDSLSTEEKQKLFDASGRR